MCTVERDRRGLKLRLIEMPLLMHLPSSLDLQLTTYRDIVGHFPSIFLCLLRTVRDQ